MALIYKITNITNNKCYIGKTERALESRWAEHKKNINTLQHLPLYKALKKYGILNFTIETIEECSSEEVDSRETFWIKQYNSCENGYNCTLGGEGGLLYISDKELNEIIDRYQNGERIDFLCKEYHHDYYAIKRCFEERGIKINSKAGPEKLSKKIMAIDPITLQIIKEYESISAAARDICQPGRNPRAIGNHISKYKDTSTVSHGYLWKSKFEKELGL